MHRCFAISRRDFLQYSRILFVFALLMLVAAQSPLRAADETLDFVRFSTPQGWTLEPAGGSARMLSSPAGGGFDAKIMLIATPESNQALDLKANFSEALKGIFQGRKIVQSSEQVSSKTAEGYPSSRRTSPPTISRADGSSLRSRR
jgi:hypothetical protein